MYVDLTGSGIETVSHMKENGRITFMFCSFEPGLPRIVRLYGKGRAIEKCAAGRVEFQKWMMKIKNDMKLDGMEVSTEVYGGLELLFVARFPWVRLACHPRNAKVLWLFVFPRQQCVP